MMSITSYINKARIVLILSVFLLKTSMLTSQVEPKVFVIDSTTNYYLADSTNFKIFDRVISITERSEIIENSIDELAQEALKMRSLEDMDKLYTKDKIYNKYRLFSRPIESFEKLKKMKIPRLELYHMFQFKKNDTLNVIIKAKLFDDSEFIRIVNLICLKADADGEWKLAFKEWPDITLINALNNTYTDKLYELVLGINPNNLKELELTILDTRGENNEFDLRKYANLIYLWNWGDNPKKKEKELSYFIDKDSKIYFPK